MDNNTIIHIKQLIKTKIADMNINAWTYLVHSHIWIQLNTCGKCLNVDRLSFLEEGRT